MAVVHKSELIYVGDGRLGRGVFAAADIAKGEIVEVCPTLEVDDSAVSGELGNYIFSSNDDEHTAIMPLGFGMLYNHSADANCAGSFGLKCEKTPSRVSRVSALLRSCR